MTKLTEEVQSRHPRSIPRGEPQVPPLVRANMFHSDARFCGFVVFLKTLPKRIRTGDGTDPPHLPRGNLPPPRSELQQRLALGGYLRHAGCPRGGVDLVRSDRGAWGERLILCQGTSACVLLVAFITMRALAVQMEAALTPGPLGLIALYVQVTSSHS